MFERLASWMRRVKSKVIPTKTVYEAFGVRSIVSGAMEAGFLLWDKMYRGQAAPCEPPPIGLPAAIASEIARAVMLEFSSAVSGSGRADFLNGQYQRILPRLRGGLEKGCATGNLFLKPWVNLENREILVDFVSMDGFIPTQYNGRHEITGGIFIDQIVRDGEVFSRMEFHSLTGGTYTIQTKAYRGDGSAALGREINLSDVPEWADIQPFTEIAGIKKPLFAVFRYPLANNLDGTSPLGVSCFSRAVELIGQADRQWERIQWEFEGSELAIDASSDLFKKDKKGNPVLPQGRERQYRTYDFDETSNLPLINVFSPEIRDESLFNGLNEIFKRIEYNCGLSYGILSNPQTVALTATEIKYSKARFHDTVHDAQAALAYTLEQLVYAMDAWADYYGLAPAGAYTMSFNWDDSVLVDTETKRQMMLQDVRDGLIPKWMYTKEFYNVSEEEAKRMTGTPLNDNALMGFADADA